MKPKIFYKNDTLRYLYIYINYIVKVTNTETLYNVTWWRQDETTGKMVSMNEDQDMWIKKNDPQWVPLDETISMKVMKHWRPG